MPGVSAPCCPATLGSSPQKPTSNVTVQLVRPWEISGRPEVGLEETQHLRGWNNISDDADSEIVPQGKTWQSALWKGYLFVPLLIDATYEPPY